MILRIFCLVILLFWQTAPYAEEMSKKRADPEIVDVEPVVINHIRYEVVQWGKARGLEQNGGYIAAYEEVSNKELWITKIYDVHYKSDMEEDKQDVFITRIKLKNKHLLEVENERGQHFLLDLTTHKVLRE